MLLIEDLTLQLTFTASLTDRTSKDYTELAESVEQSLAPSLRVPAESSPDVSFVGVQVVRFHEGSVKVDFVAVYQAQQGI